MSYTAPGYPHLSFKQLENVWTQAGGPKKLAKLMAAVALAESGGWAGATNPTDNGGTQTSWGLWQISNGTHSSPAGGGDVYDPLTNARLAVGKYHSQGLGAWGTYTSGAYKSHLDGNGGGYEPAAGSSDAGGTGGGTGGAGAVLTSAKTPEGIVDCYVKFPQINLHLFHLGPWCVDKPIFGLLTLAGAGAMIVGAALIAVGAGSDAGAARAIVHRTRTVTKV